MKIAGFFICDAVDKPRGLDSPYIVLNPGSFRVRIDATTKAVSFGVFVLLTFEGGDEFRPNLVLKFVRDGMPFLSIPMPAQPADETSLRRHCGHVKLKNVSSFSPGPYSVELWSAAGNEPLASAHFEAVSQSPDAPPSSLGP